MVFHSITRVLLLPAVLFCLSTTREAAKASGPLEEPVKLTVDAQRITTSTVNATLTNATTRPIVFLAYVDHRPRNIYPPDKLWVALNGTDVFESGAWFRMKAAWCGMGAGGVKVEPGKSARLQLGALPRTDAICRAKVYWKYFGEPSDIDWRGAVSEIIHIHETPAEPLGRSRGPSTAPSE